MNADEIYRQRQLTTLADKLVDSLALVAAHRPQLQWPGATARPHPLRWQQPLMTLTMAAVLCSI